MLRSVQRMRNGCAIASVRLVSRPTSPPPSDWARSRANQITGTRKNRRSASPPVCVCFSHITFVSFWQSKKRPERSKREALQPLFYCKSNEFHRCSIGHYFSRRLHDRGGGISDTNDCIRAHGLRFRNHPFCCQRPRVIHHLIVPGQFPADKGFETCPDVSCDIDGLSCLLPAPAFPALFRGSYQ